MTANPALKRTPNGAAYLQRWAAQTPPDAADYPHDHRHMKARSALFLALPLFAAASSFANPSTYLSCDIVVQQWGPNISREPVAAKIDLTIDGAGKTLRITSTGEISGASFYGAAGRNLEVLDRSTEALWDVTIFQYRDGESKRLFSEERLVLNRYTGTVRIQSKGPETFGASSEGTCKRHSERKF